MSSSDKGLQALLAFNQVSPWLGIKSLKDLCVSEEIKIFIAKIDCDVSWNSYLVCS